MDDGMIQNNIGHIKPLMPNSIIKPGGANPNQQIDGKDSFSNILKDSIQSVNQLQKDAAGKVEQLANGEIKDVDQVIVAMQEAGVTFKLMMKVRNQLLTAYQEISKSS